MVQTIEFAEYLVIYHIEHDLVLMMDSSSFGIYNNNNIILHIYIIFNSYSMPCVNRSRELHAANIIMKLMCIQFKIIQVSSIEML